MKNSQKKTKLPFAKAEVVRLMKENLDDDKNDKRTSKSGNEQIFRRSFSKRL